MTSLAERPLVQKLLKLTACKIYVLENWLAPLALLAARLHVGLIFWRSGTDKNAEGWQHAKDTWDTLFRDEFAKNNVKHWLGMDIHFPVPPTWFGAFGITYVEIALAALLIVGLASRAAAFGIFVMALTIELFVYPNTDENYYWMTLMAILVTVGPGKASLDWLIRRKLLKNELCDTKTT